MLQKIFLCGLTWVFVFPMIAFAQVPQAERGNEHFLDVSASIGYSAFRDQGVSPILYQGFTVLGGLRYTMENELWDFSVEGEGGVGFYEATRLAVYETSTIHVGYGGHLRRQFWASESARLRYEGGLRLHGLVNVRRNSSLFNAATGVTNINTLFLSNELTWLVSLREKTKKSGRTITRRRPLSLEVNIPLLNVAWLPDYAYITEFTHGEPRTIGEHKLYWGGLRFQTRLSYRHFFTNGNALRFSYVSDYVRTSETFNQIDFINHAFQFSLVMRLH